MVTVLYNSADEPFGLSICPVLIYFESSNRGESNPVESCNDVLVCGPLERGEVTNYFKWCVLV